MTLSIVIIGCGGFGREVWSIVKALGAAGERWDVEGFVDDLPSEKDLERITALGSSFIGRVSELALRQTRYSAIIAIGSTTARQRIHATLAASPVSYPRLVHPDSTLGQRVLVGEGVVIAPGARLSTNVKVGAHVHIDQNVTVGHDTTIGDFSRLNPQACVSGSVTIGRHVLVGAGATVLQELRLGHDSVVGAGACVVKDVAEGAVVKGIPAR